MTTHVFPNSKAAAEACAEAVATRLTGAIAARQYATLAVSGGNSPRPMFARLKSIVLPWDRIHVFWVDERAVPPSDPQSNYRLAAESLLDGIGIPPGNVHRIRAELAPEAAAHEYVREIRSFFGLRQGEMPEFDVMHRGIGPDAHTASLFPGQPLIEDRKGIAAAVYVDKIAQWRITLLPGPLLAARSTVMLVAGEDKAEPLRAVLQEPSDPIERPAQLLPAEVEWFLDEAAARLLNVRGRSGRGM